MLLLVPLGDIFERSRILILSALGAAITALGMALAPTLPLLLLGSFGLGLMTLVPYLLPPFAAQLVPENQRGRLLGIILSGQFTGLLLARLVSGSLAEVIGWRWVYALAAVAMALLALIFWQRLPQQHPQATLSYRQLITSLWPLFQRQQLLRQSSLIQGMLFGSFIACWSALALFVAGPPYHYGTAATGLFGLVGLCSILAARPVGGWVDRFGARRVVGVGILLTALGWLSLGLAGRQLWGLLLGLPWLILGCSLPLSLTKLGFLASTPPPATA